MRILIHDYAGHPFSADLSRSLAARGHQVTHAWFAGDIGPKGRLQRGPTDPEGLVFAPLGAAIAYSKTNFLRRRRGDIAYGKALAQLIHQTRPDLVLSGNTPTEAQEALRAACNRDGARFIYWCQDFYSLAVSRILARKLPLLGAVIGAYYRALERRQMHRAAAVIHITEDFCRQTDAWGLGRDKIAVIPNWGPICEIAVQGRDTDWAQQNRLNSGARFLYTGTLAMKHNPALLTALARNLQAQDQLLVIASGSGADQLAAQKPKDLAQLRCFGLQPIGDFGQVLASGNVLLAMIEREAGSFSVPSKILSYLCAGRPIVLAAPKENLAARIVTISGAGIVVAPEDSAGFVRAALAYRDDPVAAQKAGAAGRAYAEAQFDLGRITDRFEAVFAKACPMLQPMATPRSTPARAALRRHQHI
jgi:colanic acid biosynthesis glycosyl transferase WcaI